jgi:hypothetical protein
MRKHWDRNSIYIAGEGFSQDPGYLSGMPPACAASGERREPSPDAGPGVKFKFGRMFERRRGFRTVEDSDCMIEKLIKLGQSMNAPERIPSGEPDADPGDSDIPSGYTYLGQFIAHEITFNKQEDFSPCALPPENMRSPQIDLDCLYGGGPDSPTSSKLYQDRARLKEGQTTAIPDLNTTFPNDLPRNAEGACNSKEALLGDPRNDENLAVAQTHLAFIKFHNEVVDILSRKGCPQGTLFGCARKLVAQHFQWIILEDYLPRFLDESVLNDVRGQTLSRLKVEDKDGLFMPLEFAAAAFRVGHSMIRNRYEWNAYHCSDGLLGGRPAHLFQLFKFTNFSGDLDGAPSLKSDWVIDWRRFYDFEDSGDELKYNRARKIDTVFDLRLDKIPNYPHLNLPETHRSIMVRNLLRGFALGLPTGEEVAEQLGETPLSPEEVSHGLGKEILSDSAFYGRTPLWYYILKEAELNGGSRLGPVGSRIIAETFVGLIRKSPYSILATPGWRPVLGRPVPGAKGQRFEMTDLLNIADCVDPIGRHFKKIYSEEGVFRTGRGRGVS